MSYIKPWVAGAAMAVVAVLAGAFVVTDPSVYGLCVACHARDLIDGTFNQVLGADLPVASIPGGGAMLTTAGLLIGAYLGARTSGERRPRPAGRPLLSLGLGVVAMCSALVALGCMTRLLLRAAYGDTLAYWAIGGVAVGIGLATGLLAWCAKRWTV